MMKRSGENLARTVDGAPYNKLQRPDNFPTAPARPVSRPDIELDLDGDDEYLENLLPDQAPHESEYQNGQKPAERIRHKNKVAKTWDIGMRGAFPGLDDEDTGRSSDDEESREAMRYLRQVRSQALDLPCVVRANSPTPEEELDSATYGLGDSRGYYDDGAYVAAPQIGPVIPDDLYSDSEDDMMQILRLSPQEAYTTRLLTLFWKQRAILQSPSFKNTKPASRINLVTTLRDRDPTPTQLATMTTKSVFRLLELVTKCLRRGENVSPRTSAWMLAILARMDEREMDSDNIYFLREFGRKAMWVRLCFDKRFAEQTNELGHNFESESKESTPTDLGAANTDQDLVEQSRGRQQAKGDHTRRRNTSSLSSMSDRINGRALESIAHSKTPAQGPVDSVTSQPLDRVATPIPGSQEDIEFARERLLAMLEAGQEPQVATERVSDQSGSLSEDEDDEGKLPNNNTKATLDMIITIVGEIYGQRDLLEARIDWIDL